ncbi:MAG: Dyp-type peroxidase [Candidatus Rokuibacteriota bacterium]
MPHSGSDRRRLQDGIYAGGRDSPDRAYRLLLLNVKRSATLAQARTAITSVWKMLEELRNGVVRDLRSTRDGVPHAPVPPAALTGLLGFGARLFDHDSRLPPHGNKPTELIALRQGPNEPFSSLHWTTDGTRAGEADLALQFIAETELAVNRAVAEVYRLLVTDALPLEFVASYGGFNREDKRSWLNFHDGISNLAPDQRLTAIEVTVRDPEWMDGGTYMVFLRLALNLETWWRLPREQQEALVGRDKLSGCPLQAMSAELVPVVADGCPLAGGPPENPKYKDPPETRDSVLAVSHIYRANPTRLPPSDRTNRIFRQGYEFLESPADGQLRFGLNFVSFQRALARFTEILTKDGWLKQVNFAGHTARPIPPPIELARIVAGGYYAIPRKSDPFPGAEIFTERSDSRRRPSEAGVARRPP